MNEKSPQGQRLFLSAGFETFQVGLASEKDIWFLKDESCGHITDQLSSALETIIEQCCFDDLTLYLLNGPGSTLGIRTLCAFIRTLFALDKIKPEQVFTCSHLHFAQAYLRSLLTEDIPPICARVNLTKVLCLTPSQELHIATESEMQDGLWLPHPCLKDKKFFTFSLNKILPLLQPQYPWQNTHQPDIISYENLSI